MGRFLGFVFLFFSILLGWSGCCFWVLFGKVQCKMLMVMGLTAYGHTYSTDARLTVAGASPPHIIRNGA